MNKPQIQAGRRKRSHEVVELIEAAIASGEYAVGDRLPSEKELAERFGVGRPSVREALFMLQQQGLVDITSGARARVTAPSASFFTDSLRLWSSDSCPWKRPGPWSRHACCSRRASRGRRRNAPRLRILPG